MTAAANSWDAELYESRHAFVWQLGADLIDVLDPKPGERVLDVGCGSGHLTQKIADRGAVPLFVDGRAATAYPDDLLRDYFKLSERDVDEAAWDAVLQKYRIDTVLWVREHQQLRRFLVDKRGWKEAYDGMYETIYVKP